MAGPHKGPLRIAIEDWLETWGIGKRISAWFDGLLDHLEEGAISLYSGLLDRLGVRSSIPSYLLPEILVGGGKPRQTGVVIVLGAVIGSIVGILFACLGPLQRIEQYKAERLFKSARLDISTAGLLGLRDPARAETYFEDLRDQGWTTERISAYTLLLQPILPAIELETLRLRNRITQAAYDSEMEHQGYTPARIQQIKDLMQVIPGPSDLVTMAVREAWNEEIVALFGYDELPPPEFGEWMSKQGSSTDWAKRYWRAHWQLPGLGQAFEMYQRLRPGVSDTPFELDDLQLYLRAADIPKYFRDRLTAIAYTPLTRVDVRRMYGTGTLDAEGVHKSYLDLGYNESDATLMTDFTTSYEKSSQKDLTRAAIVGAYSRGQISRGDAESKLTDIGYTSDNADFYLAIADYDIAAALVDDKLAAIRAKYVDRQLDESTVMDALGPLNLPAERQTALLDLWGVSRDNKVALLSRSELDDMLRRGLFEHDEYRTRLAQDGYLEDTIDLYVQRIDLIIQEDANIEAQTAQTEQDRISRSKLASDYAKDRASTNVSIAEARAAIADINVALHAEITVEEADALKTRIVEIRAQISQYNIDNASLKLEFEVAKAPKE